MKYKKFAIVLVAIFSMSTLTGFGIGDLKLDKDKAKDAAKVAVVVGAAAILIDMVINYKSKQTKTEQVVISEQKAKNQQLPTTAAVNSYVTTILPGKVVKLGQATKVQSIVYVTPGLDNKAVKIEEKVELINNKNESLKEAMKQVTSSKQKGGEFTNEFSFTIPKGLEDGVYTVKNTILFDGQQQKVTNSSVQYVLTTLPDNTQQLALLD